MSTTTMFRPATRQKVRGRIALDGPAGSGKTFTALRLATALAEKPDGSRGRIAVINTESGAVEKYLGLQPDGTPWAFDVCELSDMSPTSYTAAILGAAAGGYAVLVIDSFSHSWAGTGGALELVDKKGDQNRGNKFTAWKDVTPMMSRMVDAILRSPCHVIATMRTKMEYILEEYTNDQGQKRTSPRKVGMAPIQRQGVEYEFDVVCDLDLTHTLTVSKSRCPDLDGLVVVKPGAAFFAPLISWLNDGTEVDPSHYIATEDDLRRSEVEKARREKLQRQADAADVASAKAAEAEAKPKKSAVELMKEKAAAAKGGDGNGAATTAAATAAGSMGSGIPPVKTESQKAAIETEAVAARADQEASAAANQEKASARWKAAQEASSGVANGGTGTVENGQSADANAPCSAIQVNAIRTLLADLGAKDSTLKARIKAWIEKLPPITTAGGGETRMRLKVTDLNHEQADVLTSKLRAMAAKEELAGRHVEGNGAAGNGATAADGAGQKEAAVKN